MSTARSATGNKSVAPTLVWVHSDCVSAEFALRIRKWRGNRTQSVAAYILKADIETYRNWEYGRAEPAGYAMELLAEKMAANPEKPSEPQGE